MQNNTFKNLCLCGCGLKCARQYRFRHNPPNNFCECGCENLCKNRFVSGHNQRGKPSPNKGKYAIHSEEQKKLCLCGCGKIPKLPSSKYCQGGQHFLKGRQKSKNIEHTKEEKELWPNLCLCGCGQKCRRKFVHGHNNMWQKGICHSKEQIQKMAAAKRGKTAWSKGLTREIDKRIRTQTEDEKSRRLLNNSGHKRFSYINSNGIIIKMRSNWEVLYAQFLDNIKVYWKYESKGFRLSNGHHYYPDFYLPDLNEWHEIKGWTREKDKEKMDLFQKNYPDKKLVIIRKVPDYIKNYQKRAE